MVSLEWRGSFMEFGKSVFDIMEARHSWRSYREDPVPDSIQEGIRSFIAGLPEPPFGSRVRFSLNELDRSRGKRPQGTYGVINGASLFLAGILTPGGMGFEDFGYLFERVILHVTSQGLGSCWLGGTFDSSYFSGLSGLQEKEIIPAVSPVGFTADKRTLLDTAFVLFIGSRKRKPWSELFFQDTFGNSLDRESTGAYARVLDMVRIAPSASNKQPWRVIRRDGAFHFFLTRTPGYSALIRSADLQRIDMGIAMLHFELAVRESGLSGKWERNSQVHAGLPERTHYVVSWVP
jgi:nitroreductase